MQDWMWMVAIFVGVWLVLGRLLRGRLIDGASARSLVGGGARLVDVRSPAEFASGHLPAARNIPLDQLPGRLKELQPADKPVVLYCASGARSGFAARTLRKHGFSNVHNLGSIRRW